VSIRVLLADDEPLIRAGLAMLLAAEPDIEVVAEAGDGEEAIGAVLRAHPDVAVLDVRMPVLDGVAATGRIRALTGTAVLVLTTYNLDAAVHAALRAGASGFLLKDAAPAELTGAIRAVAAGHGWLAPVVARMLIGEFAAQPATLPAAGQLHLLTCREREVLTLVAQGRSNVEIADQLVISKGTVKTHVNRVLGKLGLRDRAQAVVAAYESGLVRPARLGAATAGPPPVRRQPLA
jgi:DNA-binding NarL/FixJ family response regulator